MVLRAVVLRVIARKARESRCGRAIGLASQRLDPLPRLKTSPGIGDFWCANELRRDSVTAWLSCGAVKRAPSLAESSSTRPTD